MSSKRASSSSSSSSSSSKSKKLRGGVKSGDDSFVIPDVSTVLTEVRRTRKALRDHMDSAGYGEANPELFVGITKVEDLQSEDVSRNIEALVVDLVSQILSENKSVKHGGFEMVMPSRTATNQKYIESLDRIVLGDKVSKRQFLNVSHVRKLAITTRVVQLVHEALSKGIHITKRDLFYTDVKLFETQDQSDGVLDDVACMMGSTRTSLHVVASNKGLVVGRIQYLESGDAIDCTKMGVGGKAIPPYIDKITEIRSDAEFIILVEKEAAYMRLAEDRFYRKYPCIIITGKGQPDVATRLFLRKIREQLKIPVLALVDSDPYGLKILSVYMSGSKQMSYDSANLTTPDIKWLGVS